MFWISYVLLERIGSFFFMIAMGWLLVKSGRVRSEDSRILAEVSICLIIPCVIINSFQIELSDEVLHGFIFALGTAFLCHILLLILIVVGGRLFHLNRVERAIIMYPNAGNLVIPIMTALYGADMILYTSAFISMQTIFMFTHGNALLEGKRVTGWKKIFSNINIISTIVGILLFVTNIRLPSVVVVAMDSVGSMLAPLCMIVTGMLIAGVDLRHISNGMRILGVCVLRLLVCPLVAILVFGIFGLEHLVAGGHDLLMISFIAMMGPGAVTITQLAQIHNQDPHYASLLCFSSTAFCIITMPVMAAVFELLL